MFLYRPNFGLHSKFNEKPLFTEYMSIHDDELLSLAINVHSIIFFFLVIFMTKIEVQVNFRSSDIIKRFIYAIEEANIDIIFKIFKY